MNQKSFFIDLIESDSEDCIEITQYDSSSSSSIDDDCDLFEPLIFNAAEVDCFNDGLRGNVLHGNGIRGNVNGLNGNGLSNGLSNNNGREKECIICKTDIASHERKFLTCLHVFHEECIDNWLHIKNNCPICRVRQPALERVYNYCVAITKNGRPCRKRVTNENCFCHYHKIR
jgi:hypothetical protein